jgi:predicted aspartyl protease
MRFAQWVASLCLVVSLVSVGRALALEYPDTLQLLAAQALSGKSKSVSANELVKEILAAYGGAEKLAEIDKATFKSTAKACVYSGISTASNCFDCEIIGQGEKIRLEAVILGQKTILGFDGKSCWTQTGDWVAPSTETTAKELAQELKHGLNQLMTLSNPKAKINLIGSKEIQGKNCDVVEAIAEDGKPTTFYADPETHLILRSEFMGKDSEQGIPALQATEYRDYRPLNGSMVAFNTTEFVNKIKKQDTIIEKYEIIPQADDSLFAMPPETEIAQVKERPVVLPFDYVQNKIIVRVRLNRQVDCRFILDTGASQTVIDKATAATLGPIASAGFSITTGAKAMTVNYTTLSAFTIGAITLDNLPVLISDLSALKTATNESAIGLLGANVLRKFLVTIDFQNKQVILSNPHKVTLPEHATALKTSPIFGATALVVEGTLNDKTKANFLVDTGASFNSLPSSAAKQVFSGKILQVGKIAGLDNEKVSIGSIKLDKLTLADLNIPNPVFTVGPESTGAKAVSGLFGAGSLGILGAPCWSRFRFTVDYRGERIILEPRQEYRLAEETESKCNQIYVQYLRTKNFPQAQAACEKLLLPGQTPCLLCQSLVKAQSGLIATEAFVKTKDKHMYELALQAFGDAAHLANLAHDKQAEARALALCAYLFLSNKEDAQGQSKAKGLLTQAQRLSQADPVVLTVFGIFAFRSGQVGLATQLTDQALMFDPASWLALHNKYDICQKQGERSQQADVLAQLTYYYPGVAEVSTLSVSSKTTKN